MNQADIGSVRSERHKVRAAEWLYRWNLSNSIIGVFFTILTFLGVFTLVLGPVFARVGLSYLMTALILLVFVVAVIIGFGLFLDRFVKFWSAQATVGTVRNPYLVDVLYQKELLALIYIQAPLLRSVRALLEGEAADEARRRVIASELDRALAKIEDTIREKRWPIEPSEKAY